MYPSKMQNTIFVKRNLHTLGDTTLRKQFHVYYKIMVHNACTLNTLNYFKSIQEKLGVILKNGAIFKASTLPQHLKAHSSKILRTWVHQCECVLAQRLRRSQQMFFLYSKLWEEQALREFIKRMRQQLTKHSKEIICSAVGITSYNWAENRIPDSEILKHKKEFEYIEKLRNSTIKCDLCELKPKSEKKICHCPEKSKFKFEEWELFIEKDDLLIWRKLHSSGCYEYKVYGSYNDVLAEDFVNVQIDINYRKTWDSSAVVLELIEKDPTPKSNSDLVYWEMQWPRLFSNRDYVFNRRFLVDHSSKTIIIANRITQHPNFPVKSDKFRVQDYWSNMVIKPYTEYNKPGLEFALTYFENSGVNVPATVTSWVAMRALPDYLTKLREATRGYDKYCKSAGKKCLCKFLYEECNQVNLVKGNDNDDFKSSKPLIRKENSSPPKQPPGENLPSPVSQHLPETVTTATNQTEYKNSYWKYLQPAYYFN